MVRPTQSGNGVTGLAWFKKDLATFTGHDQHGAGQLARKKTEVRECSLAMSIGRKGKPWNIYKLKATVFAFIRQYTVAILYPGQNHKAKHGVFIRKDGCSKHGEPCGFGASDEQVIKPGWKILRFSHEKT